MKEPHPSYQTEPEQATVCMFPLQQVLGRAEAAEYLGIPARRLRFLEMLGCGPKAVSHRAGAIQFRKEDLDIYSAEQFSRAGLGADALSRYRSMRALADYKGLDPFMDMASRDELSQACTYIGGRVGIGLGLVVIVLSHTPLSRILFHVVR